MTRVEKDDRQRAAKYLRKGAWRKAVALHEIDAMMVAHLWDIVWRSPYSFDLVTVSSDDPGWVEVLEQKFERANVPFSTLHAFPSADALAQHIAFMPNILRLYHANESWGFKFGHIGEFVSDAQIFQVR